MDTVFQCTPRETKRLIIEAMLADLVPFVQSSPGIGKSSIARGISREFGMKLLDERLSTREPVDLSGFAMKNEQGTRARYMPLEDFVPLQGFDEIPKDENGEDYEGWLLFFDEFNSAPRSVQAAAYKLILDREVGRHKVHSKVKMLCAGNLATDRAITNNFGTAMQSRLVHIEMRHDFAEWMEDVALPNNYDPRIIAFLSQWPNKLMDFRPDHQEKTFACPRTWEFVNKFVKGKEVTDERAKFLAGTITSGIAMEFNQFCKVWKELVTVKEILADPANCRVPEDPNIQWATIGSMLDQIEDKIFDKLTTYVNRFDMGFKVLFYRSVMVRQPTLRNHKAFMKGMAELSDYLNPNS